MNGRLVKIRQNIYVYIILTPTRSNTYVYKCEYVSDVMVIMTAIINTVVNFFFG